MMSMQTLWHNIVFPLLHALIYTLLLVYATQPSLLPLGGGL